ncbi:PAAR domain-containing protein [Lysobacter capsici]|uniref:PAAR domain-containing protein n=1 Tax=Lysobacter capsici TaxID=435897 RepID=UPI001C0041CC|nr:PAAR domain-containing protein [Lysobacter capsici]MBW8809392.1 PAAR domain-containing protein [Lysobacter sp.]QWF19556.1 PAAR domain-containing protein [Lysobacter capsici]
MSRPFILVGDCIDHGGAVVSGSQASDVDGRPLARIGDRVICSLHGPTVIASGDSSLIVDGQPIARHGDMTACGAHLIAGQFHATVDA